MRPPKLLTRSVFEVLLVYFWVREHLMIKRA